MISKQCIICGKIFDVEETSITSNKCNECLDKSLKGFNYKYKKIIKNCANCKAEFLVVYPEHRRILCIKCFEAKKISSQIKRETTNCIKCGKEIQLLKYHRARKICLECSAKKQLQKKLRNTVFNKSDFKFYPTNEQEIIVLFFKVFKHFNFKEIVKIQTRFPDAIIIDNNDKEVRVEFKYLASSYKSHLHEKIPADVIVCWIKDDDVLFKDIKIIELKSYFDSI